MSKKLLAILLSVIMIVTTVFTGMTVSAEDATNYVVNGNFSADNNFSTTKVLYENGTTAPTYGVWGPLGTGQNCISRAQEGDNYYLKYTRSSGGYYRMGGQVINGLTANTDYVLSFRAKNNISSEIGVGIKKVANTVIRFNNNDGLLISPHCVIASSADWINYKIEFNSADNTSVILAIGNYVDGVTDTVSSCDFDDVVLYDATADVLYVDAVAEYGGIVTGGGVVTKGEKVTLTATAKSGYEFAGWSDGESAATRTLTANADVTLTAKFNKITADYIPNGNFEADDWSLSDYWTTLSGNAGFVEAEDPTDPSNTVAYAVGGNKATSMVSQKFSIKKDHTYYIRFDSYIKEKVTATNGPQFYMVGFYKPNSPNLGSGNLVGGTATRVYTTSLGIDKIGKWHSGFGVELEYTGEDTEAVIVIGMFNNSCTSDWYVDNIVAYDTADLCDITAVAENGTATGSKSGIFKGETVTLTATPADDDHKFLGWFAEGSDTAVATTETWTFKATETATYTAKYSSKNLVVNGNFELPFTTDTISNNDITATTGKWGKIYSTVTRMEAVETAAFTSVDSAEINGTRYITSGATKDNNQYIRAFGQYIDLLAGKYVLAFDAKASAKLFVASFKKAQGSIDAANDTIVPIAQSDEWQHYTLNFTVAADGRYQIAFGGNSTNVGSGDFSIDNVVLCKESDYGVGYNVIGTFEDGADGWTATEGATVTAANTSETALNSLTKYVGSKVGVLTPAAEGDVFTSPAFPTEIGKTYDVVFYSRHNSADDTHGTFIFSAGGESESLKYAGYGSGDKYEDGLGFSYTLTNVANATGTPNSLIKYILTFTATEESHNITITTVTPRSVFVDGFEVYAHDDITSYVEDGIGFSGTAIRTTGVQGLRFKSSIKLDTLSNMGSYAKVVEYGTLAIKDEYRNGADLIIEDLTSGKYNYQKKDGTTSCRLKSGVAYDAENNINVRFDVNIYSNIFTGVLTGILESNYGADYTTRAYAKVQFADGSYTYVYGDHQSVSIDAVAQYIVDNNLETEEVREYLQTNILNK